MMKVKTKKLVITIEVEVSAEDAKIFNHPKRWSWEEDSQADFVKDALRGSFESISWEVK